MAHTQVRHYEAFDLTVVGAARCVRLGELLPHPALLPQGGKGESTRRNRENFQLDRLPSADYHRRTSTEMRRHCQVEGKPCGGVSERRGKRVATRASEGRNGEIAMSLATLGIIVTLALAILSGPRTSDAQPPVKVPRIGILWFGSPVAAPSPHLEVFRQGLRELGYVEGQNIAIDSRHAAMRAGLLPDLAANLILFKVDLIVAAGDPAIEAVKQATSMIPIVMVASAHPVESGLVASLARPGGNITGLSTLAPELSGKRLELLKEALPGASRVAVLFNPADPAKTLDLKETQVAAQVLGVQL